MEELFLGTYTPKLDEKGRLTLPAKYRERLAGGVMITKGQNHCLTVYTRSDFQEIVQRSLAASRTSPAARKFQRMFSAGTDEQRPDSQGRITLSAEHRGYAGLAKDCVVAGNLTNLEIWDATAWDEYQNQNEDDYAEAGLAVLDLTE